MISQMIQLKPFAVLDANLYLSIGTTGTGYQSADGFHTVTGLTFSTNDTTINLSANRTINKNTNGYIGLRYYDGNDWIHNIHVDVYCYGFAVL